MAQIELINLDTDWYEFTPTAGTTYHIQNRGGSIVIAQEADSEPTNTAGILVQPYKTLVYEKGTASALWLRAYSGGATVNVSTEA